MTALGRAQEMLDFVVQLFDEAEVELPVLQWAQLGEAVIQCPGVASAATIVEPHSAPEPGCVPPMTTTIACTIARDYVCVLADGTIDNEAVALASIVQQQDADLLWDATWQMSRYLGPELTAVTFLIEGGMMFTTSSFVIGVN